MKKNLILSLIALGLAGCHTADRTPYMGSMGEYGFTHDLNSSPSPFVDTSYRPLTVFDLAAPIVVVVTNRPPPPNIYHTTPETSIVVTPGEVPGINATAAGATPQINEAAGALQSTPPTAGTIQPGPAGVTSSERNYYDAPDTAVSIDSGTQSVQVTNTNSIGALTIQNTVPNVGTNQPGLAATNNVISDAAGTPRTNQFTNQLFNTNNLSPNSATPPSPPVAPTPNPAPQLPHQSANPNQAQP